ncbi:hypothetical protein LTR94_032988, partial [Friedmanniomyces endolithicus]
NTGIRRGPDVPPRRCRSTRPVKPRPLAARCQPGSKRRSRGWRRASATRQAATIVWRPRAYGRRWLEHWCLRVPPTLRYRTASSPTRRPGSPGVSTRPAIP